MAENDNSSNTPYNGPDFSKADLVRDYLTKLAQFVSGQPVAAGAVNPSTEQDSSAPAPQFFGSQPMPESGAGNSLGSQELAGAIRELATALRAFQSPVGQSPESQQFFASKTKDGRDVDDWMKKMRPDAPSVQVEPIPLAPIAPGGALVEPIPVTPITPGSVQMEPIPLAPLPPAVAPAIPAVIPRLADAAELPPPVSPSVGGSASSSAMEMFGSRGQDDVAGTTEEFKRFLFERDGSGGSQPKIATFNSIPDIMGHLMDGTDHMRDVESAANMYRDAMATFNRHVVNILEGITNDLRGDNSRLAEVERHFFQSRTSL